jgi:predicted hydrocarbon binding protein
MPEAETKKPDISNPQAQHMYDSIHKNVSPQAADEFIENFPLSKSADFERKFKWAEKVCKMLEDNYDDETIKTIRTTCSCSPSQTRMEEMKKLYDAAENYEDFTESCNKTLSGIKMWSEGNALFFSYPECYCSCVKRVNKPLSKAWCYCTLGYAKKLFDYVLNDDCEAELTESIKLGDSRCVMKITRKVP